MRAMLALSFRRLARDDFPLLARWLAQPHVHRWWNHETSPEALEADFGATVDRVDPAEVFIVSTGGRPFGLVQWYLFSDNARYIDELAPLLQVPGEALSMDYFVGEPDLLRQGWGAAMLRASLERIWRGYPAAPFVVVPVSAANEASWRVLERAGLVRVAEGPLAPDNPNDDWAHFVYRVDRPNLSEPESASRDRLPRR
jgi:aminoglycoside 6'-N-acetyltransferase